MRAGLAAVTVLVAVAAVGCGGGSGPDVVVDGTTPAAPYSGPLYVPARNLPEDDPRATRVGSGAAGRALECEGEIHAGGASDPWSRGDGGSTPEEGLKAYFDIEQPEVPRYGYRVEREEGDRVLYSFDVGGRTKAAVVVAKDRPDHPGWGPETSASCDPAEFPARFTDTLEFEIWTDKHGRRVPVTTLSSSDGPAHCDWQKAHFLGLGVREDRRTYVRDPSGVFDSALLTAAYDDDVRMPGEARDTGYRRGDWQLWRTDDTSRVYVRTPDGVEAWPRAKHGVACQ
jgi:hypothetical protein